MSESKWVEYFKRMNSAIVRNREALNLKSSEDVNFALMALNDLQTIFTSPDNQDYIICDGYVVGFEEEIKETRPGVDI